METISEIANNSDSILIIFIALVAVACVPIYKVFSKELKERFEHERINQENIIKVVSQNTEAITRLNTRLEIDSVSTKSSFERLHERIDIISDDVKKIYFYINGAEKLKESN